MRQCSNIITQCRLKATIQKQDNPNRSEKENGMPTPHLRVMIAIVPKPVWQISKLQAQENQARFKRSTHQQRM
ncbi:hypothetical protein DPMN_044634 [Dreissena polymorpha]|uniref:Uncharacterized protein n=1 Tax=Dreissena polymorpha TaxID=45954 RepID=A0A9D4D4J1_DREPO|nr:hypothetical protein DPMN_044634 [Dreissena polymorpha]